MRALKPCALSFGLLLALCLPASAAVVYDSGGFEAPRFTTGFVEASDPTVIGNLRGQDAAVGQWREAGAAGGAAAGTAIVQTGVTLSGTQAVRVDRTTNDQRWSPLFTPPVNPIGGSINIDWDMNVLQAQGDPANFGPLFGVEAYGAANGTLRMGLLGVDATTGELLFLDPITGLVTTPADTKVGFGAWNHFTLSLDFATKTYGVALNNVLLATGIGFENPGASGLSDADIASLQAAPPAFANQSGTAFFDNYLITTVPGGGNGVVPLPPAVWTGLGIGGLIFIRRRLVSHVSGA